MKENIILAIFIAFPALCALLLIAFFRRKRKRSAKRAWIRIVTANALVFAMLCSIVLLCGELYYRFVFDSTDSFGLTKVARRWFERYYHFNNAKMRDRVEYERKLSLKTRITFIGDSFTAGHGIKEVDHRFANLMRGLRRDLDIHVFAVNGYETSHEMKMVQELYNNGYEFDNVVLVYILNDISDLIPEWEKALERIYRSGKPGFLVESSYFLNMLYCRWIAARDPDISDYFRFVEEAYNGRAWEIQKRRLTTIKKWMDGANVGLFVVTFPFLHSLGPEYPYRGVHDRLENFWKDLGVPHLDLLSLYESEDVGSIVISRHDAHPNEHAHGMAANAIDEFLRSYIPERGQGK